MPAAWLYVPIPVTQIPDTKPGGWGSIPVLVTLANSEWHTSLFPIKKGSYFVPIKRAIAQKEKIRVGDSVTVSYVVR